MLLDRLLRSLTAGAGERALPAKACGEIRQQRCSGSRLQRIAERGVLDDVAQRYLAVEAGKRKGIVGVVGARQQPKRIGLPERVARRPVADIAAVDRRIVEAAERNPAVVDGE